MHDKVIWYIAHNHIMWFITYHRCTVMSFDTSHIMVMFCDTSPTIDAWYNIRNLPSMHGHVIHYLPSMHSHAIWYFTFHRYMVVFYDTSPTIDAWSYHVIHHLPSIMGHVMWYTTYCHMVHNVCMVIWYIMCCLCWLSCVAFYLLFLQSLPLVDQRTRKVYNWCTSLSFSL